MEVSEETVKFFVSLFRGRTDAWGSVEGRCNKEPVTLEHYRRHLEGVQSLGLYFLLDDGTCHVAACDFDRNDVNEPLAVRQELANLGLPSYISESKSKGHHLYLFAKTAFRASEIRRILNSTLDKVSIKAEVFPKQDMVDSKTPYGNYINLPCFGYTRQFITASLKTVPLTKLEV